VGVVRLGPRLTARQSEGELAGPDAPPRRGRRRRPPTSRWGRQPVSPEGDTQPQPVLEQEPERGAAARAASWAARRAWRGLRRVPGLGGQAFGLVTVLPAVLLVGWLVPGLALLMAGRFLPVPMVLIAAPVAVGLLMLIARFMPSWWPATGPVRKSERNPTAWWGLAGTVVVAVGFMAWQLAVNSPQLIVSRDPGANIQLGFWIAGHGSLPITASLAAFGGAHPGLTFSSFGFLSHGPDLVPSVMAGTPVTLSAGLWVHGLPGAAVLGPLAGALALLAAGGLTGRLAGPAWAPAGALLLALTVPEIYTSRSAFGETLVQALLFAGLSLVVDSLSRHTLRRSASLAALGGLALGLTVAVWIGALLMLLPTILFIGALAAGRRPQALPFTAGLLAGGGLGAASGIVLTRAAVTATTPSLLTVALIAAGFAAVTLAAVALGTIGRVRKRARRLLAARPLRWLPEAGAVVAVGLVIAFAVRPALQTVRGGPNPYVGYLQRVIHLPVEPGRLYAERSLYWLIWYLGVPALLLGVAGLAILTRRCLRALLTWRDPGGLARAWALPVAIFGWALVAVLWHPGTVPDQPWASRRLVPVVLPGLAVMAVWTCARLTVNARRRGAGQFAIATAAACFVAALVVPPAAMSFGIGPWQSAQPSVRVALAGLASQRTGGGELGTVRSLCGAIPANSSVIMVDQTAAHGFAQLVRGMCGIPVGIVPAASQADIEQVISGIARAGRHPVLMAAAPAELTRWGTSRQVLDLPTQQDAHVLTQPPTSTWPVRYALWMATPTGSLAGS
jgi:hypothetical protein